MARNVEFRGGDRLIGRIKRQQKKMRNPSRILRTVGREETQSARNRIRFTKRDPEGKGWAPWRPATLFSRIEKGNAGQGLLWDTGALLKNFYFRVTKDGLVIVNRMPYAGFLQQGTSKMRARPFLAWSGRSISRLKDRFTWE